MTSPTYESRVEDACARILEREGGGYASALAKAWIKADLANRKLLRPAFSAVCDKEIRFKAETEIFNIEAVYGKDNP